MTILHAVFGGRLTDPSRTRPEDAQSPEIIGLFKDPALADSFWKSACYANVDNAGLHYFNVALDLAAPAEQLTPLEKHVIGIIFAIGDDLHLTQLTRAKVGDTVDGTMWLDRAQSMLQCVVRPLVYLRNRDQIDLTPAVLRDHLSLSSLIDMTAPDWMPEVPVELTRGLSVYLDTVPGFRRGAGHDQSVMTKEKHGYLELALTKGLSDLARIGIGETAATPAHEYN